MTECVADPAGKIVVEKGDERSRRKRRHETVDEHGGTSEGVAVKRPRIVQFDLGATTVNRAACLPALSLVPLPQTPVPRLPRHLAAIRLNPLEELRAYDARLLPPLIVNALRKPTAISLAFPGKLPPVLPQHLSISDFFPDDGDVGFIPDVYFLQRPVEPAWSVNYCRSFARFLQACGSSNESLVYECTIAGYGYLRPGSEPLYEQSVHLTARQPDKRVVYQNAAIAGPLDGFEQLPKVLQLWVLTIRKVLVWAMDWKGELSTGQVLRFIKEARPAAHLIVREFADVLRIRQLVRRLERQVLASPPHKPTPTEQAARTILEWLNEVDDEERKFNFFCHVDGKVKDGKEKLGAVGCAGGRGQRSDEGGT